MKRENYLKWQDYFMGVADLSAQRSKDPKTQVGCCIVDPSNNHIVSIGYNGLPMGFDDNEFNWESSDKFMDNKHSYIVHAEANAILNASQSLEGCDVYVSMFPCNECAKLLSQSKIKKVIYKDDKYLHKEQGKVASIIFEKAGIQVVKYDGKKEGE
jgi:dCMP deaminase